VIRRSDISKDATAGNHSVRRSIANAFNLVLTAPTFVSARNVRIMKLANHVLLNKCSKYKRNLKVIWNLSQKSHRTYIQSARTMRIHP
jgi:hypothetical protein